MESRNGNASEMPRPRTTVRRGSDFRVMTVLSSVPILAQVRVAWIAVRGPSRKRGTNGRGRQGGQQAWVRGWRQREASTRHALPARLRSVGVDGWEVGLLQVRV